MIRANGLCATVVFGLVCTFGSTSFAHTLWQCGDGADIALTIHQTTRDPSPGTLYGPSAPHVLTGPYVALDCAVQGHGLGTEWVCAGANDNPVDLLIEVRRGRRTNDPWALATVTMGDKIIAEALPCTVEQVRKSPQ